MQSSTSTNNIPNIKFGEAGWIAPDPLPRDQEQSHRLHEPTSMVSSIDPISGHDVRGGAGHPSVVDGILTVYFESEETRKAYLNTPFNHPSKSSPGEPSDEYDRGG